MNTDPELALRYAPIIHFDKNETIFPRGVGYTVFRETGRSASFPTRMVEVPEGAAFTVEYAYYFDYDIGHMYDLEHIWVTCADNGSVLDAQGSFHGKYLGLTVPQLHGSIAPDGTHVHAFCQPGKHAFLAAGELTCLYPGWDICCSSRAGGPVLTGAPFSATYSPAGRDLFVPKKSDNEHSARYLKEALAFTPSLNFEEKAIDESSYMPWESLFRLIPGWIQAECARLDKLYGGE